jgi:antiviral helicase SKI2
LSLHPLFNVITVQINSANELVLTELILENTLANYEPEEVVALLSCFIFQEKTEVESSIPPKLQEGRDSIMAINDRVGRVQDRHKVASEEFRSALKFGLTEVVYEWAQGMVRQQSLRFLYELLNYLKSLSNK